jgi:uncharacterized membrane protein YgdD (TMEM256/DUF423 family)
MMFARGPSVSLFLVAAAVMGFVGVAAGAFGAHAIRNTVPSERLATFETGVRYLMYHALALFAIAWLRGWPGGELPSLISGWCFIAGSVAFSGSLFALALTGEKRWGAVTPIGGVLLLIGWAALAWAALITPSFLRGFTSYPV